ncbi:MAG: helix-turn-helix transcriptional regulator [Opitutales bacterium]|nr:helix-turn-helix transcriptional regulator [Opitutales bacterium]
MNPIYSDLSTVRQKNSTLEAAGLEWLGFRLPSLRVETYFYYKVVESCPFSVGVHGHDHWEMTRLVSGAARYEARRDAKTVEMDPDSERFLVIPPKVSHRWEMREGPLLLNSWQIRFYPEDDAGSELLGQLRSHVEAEGFLVKAYAFQAETEDTLWKITDERFYPSVVGPMVSGVARIVVGGLIGALRPWPQELCERESSWASSSETLANKLKDFIEANLHNPITLVDLESHFHYSSRHLNRIFHQYFHSSIGQYLRDRRFELATRWLVTTNRSVKDIALSLGYGNISHFCRYFRKRKQVSPTEYREKSQHKEQSNTFVDLPH